MPAVMNDDAKVADGAPEQITIKVRDQTGLDNGAELFFKVKMNTKLQKVFIVYAQRKGVNVKALRFSFDGERIKDDQTPKVLGMEDQDQLDCFAEQIGGF